MRSVLIFSVVAGLGFTVLFALTGHPIPDPDLGRLVITPPQGPQGGGEGAEVQIKWKGKPIGLALTPGQKVEKVDVPLVDPATQLEEGRFTFASGSFDAKLKRLRVQQPKVVLWELDQTRKLVDRSRETTLVARHGLIDPDFKQADLYVDVELNSTYRETEALLQTSHLKCHLQSDRVTTDQALAISYGKDFKVLGEGLDATPKTGEATILRNALVRLVQRGSKMALPFTRREPAPAAGQGAKEPELTEIITTCDGKLYVQRADEGKAFRVMFHDNVEVVRGKGRMRSEVLALALETVKKPPSKKKPGASEKGIDLRELTAYDRVHMFHPTQGEAHGDFFRWEKLPSSQRQRAVLRGSPRLVLTERAGLELQQVGKQPPTEASRNRTVITSKGEMVYLRDDPQRESGAPDRAIFRDHVVLRRMVADLKQGDPLEIHADKLTLFIEVEQAPAPKKKVDGKKAEAERKARVRRCVAEGDVRVIDPSFEASGQRCNWHDLGEGDERLVMIGRPMLLLKNVSDDDYVDLPGAGGKKGPALKSDVEIASRGEMVMRSYEQRAFTRGIFDEDVVVRRFPRDAQGRRLPESSGAERRSTMLSDHLEVDLARAPRAPQKQQQPGEPGNRFVMQELRARGNVQISSAQGQATSQELVYHKATDRITLIEEVLLLAPDGSRYQGDKMIYLRGADLMELVSTRPRPAEVRQIESPPPGAARDAPRAEHLLRAPRILYDRKRHYLKATGGVYGRFLPRSDDEDSFGMLGPAEPRKKQPAGKAQASRTPWVLKARVVEAWTEPPAPKGKQPAGQAGRLRRLKALGKVHIYSTAEQDPREAQGELFDHDRLRRLTLLEGGGKQRAEIWSGTNQITSHTIRFDHATETTTCPTGGRFRFKEKPAEQKDGRPQAGRPDPWVTITCDGLVTHDRKQGLATFRKNVKIVRADAEVRGDWARAEIDQKTRRVRRAVATGIAVKIFFKKDHATGTRLVWDYQTKLATLTGSPRALLVTEDRLIRADRVTFDQQTQEASYSGNVVIERRK